MSDQASSHVSDGSANDWVEVAERLAREVLAPNAAEVDRQRAFPAANIDALRASGLLSLLVPSEMGGPGGDLATAVKVATALAQGCSSTAMSFQMHQATIPLMCSLVDEAQFGSFIQPILERGRFGAFAMSEPGSGNRIWHMDSYAQPDSSGYSIDSFKSFVTSAGHADFYVLPVRAGADFGPTELSLFVIDGDDPQVEPKGKWQAMGLRGNASCPVHFNGCRVPAHHRLGPPTAGFAHMMAYALPIYLIGLSACYVGMAKAAFAGALAHVRQRTHSDTGNSLGSVETVQRYVAEMKVRVDQAEAAVSHVAERADAAAARLMQLAAQGLLTGVPMDHDDDLFVDIVGLKVIACEAAKTVSDLAMQVCGGLGYKEGHVVERCYRDARAGSVMGPSDDVVKIIVGRQLLGVPQPWEARAEAVA